MNPSNPSLERICWTATALNHCLPLHTSIKDMRISRKERANKLVAGTTEDVQKLQQHIQTKLGLTHAALRARKRYSTALFYPQESVVERVSPPSDALEEAFNKVADVYVMHQFNWDDAEAVHVVDPDDSNELFELHENDILQL